MATEQFPLYNYHQSYQETVIPTKHEDTIHDISFDFSGRRLATCSSDQKVCVWDISAEGKWICTSTFKAHNGPIWRVTWSHPQFGQILATCSFDCCVNIWQEKPLLNSATGKYIIKWNKEASRVDSPTNVNDIKFSPHFLGLQLAACADDGKVRIYKANDIMRLNDWDITNEFESGSKGSCISWSQSSFFSPLLAVGSDDRTNGLGEQHLGIFHFQKSKNSWKPLPLDGVKNLPKVNDLVFAGWMGKSCHLLAIGGHGLFILEIKPCNILSGQAIDSDPKYDNKLILLKEHEQLSEVWRVHWNITGDVLISSSNDRSIIIWRQATIHSWDPVKELVASRESYDSVSINPIFQSTFQEGIREIDLQDENYTDSY